LLCYEENVGLGCNLLLVLVYLAQLMVWLDKVEEIFFWLSCIDKVLVKFDACSICATATH
jgi:cobalamin synthase